MKEEFINSLEKNLRPFFIGIFIGDVMSLTLFNGTISGMWFATTFMCGLAYLLLKLK